MRNMLIARLAVLAILATMTVACGKGSGENPNPIGPSAPADPLRGSIIVIAPATHLNPGALGNQQFQYSSRMGDEVEFVATGGDPSGDWVIQQGTSYGMDMRLLGENRFAVKIRSIPPGTEATRHVRVSRGERTSVLVIYEQN